jgi:conjugal transfer ATP-binding protein TraC
MQIVMFLASELMFRTSREQRVALVIDEAWSMLADDSTAAFIEGLVRRVRKYNGSLITGTQSLSDYDGNASARICKENSSWLLIMGQEADTLERYREMLSVSDGQLEKLKRVNSVRGAYSEFILRTERMFIAGRLVLDPTHLLMFSTNGAVTERYRQHRKSGKSPVAAVQELVREGLKP